MGRKIKAKIINHSSTGRTLTVNLEIKFPINRWKEAKDILDRVKKNKNWMLEHLGDWADWDYSSTVHLFADALERLGKGLIKWDNNTMSLRNGRRALFAARRLKKLIEIGDYYMTPDKSMDNHSKRQRRRDVPVDGYVWWKPIYDYDNLMGMGRQEYENKMYKVITKRLKYSFETEWADTWAYIGKYLRHWWD